MELKYQATYTAKMKISVKTLALFTIFPGAPASINAQLKLPVMGETAADVRKVVNDFPNRFANLMGEVIAEHAQSTDYECNFIVKGAEESFFTRYSSKKEVCSWEALMLTTESFDKAKQKFRYLYNQLNNLSANIGEAGNVRFKAKYETPDRDKKFTSVIFDAGPSTELSSKLKLEITLQFYEPMEWKVKVLIYDRDREDKERGPERE